MTHEQSVRVKIGRPGPPGSGITLGEKTDITSRLTDLEAVVVPSVLDDMTDVDLTTTPPASGDLLQYDGTDWVPYTPAGITQTFLMPFYLDGDGSAIAAATYYASGIPVPSACTITGWHVGNSGAHTIVTSIQRRPAGSTTWSTISGTEGPSSTLAEFATDLTLTTWTVTSLDARDALRVIVASGTATESTISILLSRTLTWS